jgi:hypothetical protein
MPSTSLLMYNDCKTTLDAAIESPDGLDVNCGTYAQAVVFRRRCNHFRKLDRLSNETIYPEEHRMHGRSVYDTLVLSLLKKPNDHIISIHHRVDFGLYPMGPHGSFHSGDSNGQV